jgi:Rps23 Pro-64 3,4-dihydroxylase Tpa1-like proline 4-hydroxylase
MTRAAYDVRVPLKGKVTLPDEVDALSASYHGATPFPHLVLDNMFSDRYLEPLLEEIAEMQNEQWVNVDRDPRERTVRMRSAAELGSAGSNLLNIVHTAAFLQLLAQISGVGQLLPDPYLQGGGFAVMKRGDYFDVHADRNVAYETGLIRRLAMIIFLNKSWKTEYNGQLELWTPDGKRREVSIDPLYNRTVLFEVAFPNYHGVPAPLACPSDILRQSFIVYYHTASVGAQPASIRKPHTTIFAPRFHETHSSKIRSVIRDIVPPFVTRMVRKFRET